MAERRAYLRPSSPGRVVYSTRTGAVRCRTDAASLRRYVSRLPNKGRGSKLIDRKARAVVTAADNWLAAIQAMSAADEAQRGTATQQSDLDDAEVALSLAVKEWRGAGRPD
jgi:hypothetical protein